MSMLESTLDQAAPIVDEPQLDNDTQSPSALESTAEGLNYEEGSKLLSTNSKGDERKKGFEKKLGGLIGGKLYELIHEHLSVDKLNEYGMKGIGSLADLAKSIKKTDPGALGGLMDEDSEVAAVQKMAELLLGWAQGEAEKWLAGEAGQKLLTKINDFVEESPYVMASTAVGAAIIGAVVLVSQNYDPDAFEAEFGIGESVKMSAGLDIGGIRDLCLQGASLGVKYHKERYQASLGADWKSEDGVHTVNVSGDASIKTEGGDTHAIKGGVEATSEDSLKATGGYTYTGADGAKGSLNANLEQNKDGSQTVGVNAAYVGSKNKDGEKPFSISGAANMITDENGEASLDLKGMLEGNGYKLDVLSQGQPGGLNTKGALSIGDPNNLTTLSGNYNQTDGELGFNLSNTIKDGGLTLNQNFGSDGGAFDLNYQGGKNSFNASMNQGADGFNSALGYNFKDKNTDFGLGLNHGQDATTANASLEHSVGNWKLSSAAELNLTDKQLTKIQGELGHTSKDETTTWLLTYAREASKSEGSYLTKDQFKLAFSKAVDQASYNASASLDLSEGKVESAGLHLDAKTTSFKASLDLAMKRNAADAFDLSTSLKFGSGKSFNGLDLSYDRTWNDGQQGYKHNLALSAEAQLGKLGLRGQGAVSTFNGSDFDTDVSLTGAYPIGGNKKLIAGMGYENVNGQDAFKAIGGVQIGNVPLTVTYTPEKKEVSFGASLTFDQISSFFK